MTETPETSAEDAQACTAASLTAGEPTLGTAPRAVAWVALEQDGPWGAKALTQSQLDPVLGARIEELAATAGVRPALIRTPGRHSSGVTEGPRRVLVAHTTPGRSWLLEGTVADPADLLGLDWDALAAGDRAAVTASLPVLELTDEPHLLVCTNGKRDTCCAVLGRPVARDAWSAVPGRVWETTHVSGHRFAATTVLLPSGYLHGRLDTASALQVLADADVGLLPLEPATGDLRGRSTWSAAGQVAEGEVRRTSGEEDLDALVVTDEEPAADGTVLVTVQHTDGRSWGVSVEEQAPRTTRAESCGKDPVPMVHLTGRVVTAP